MNVSNKCFFYVAILGDFGPGWKDLMIIVEFEEMTAHCYYLWTNTTVLCECVNGAGVCESEVE